MQGDAHIRAGTLADAAAVVRLVNAAYRVGGERAWTTEAHLVRGPRVTEDGFRALVSRPGSVVLVCERAGGIVGCVHLQSEPGRACHLGMLSVDPREQASGVGRALLAAGEAHARDQFGAREMSMFVVSVRPELLAWYERRGYVRTGERVPFQPPPHESLVAGPLEFVRLVKLLS